jgi:hypothetical protein
MWIPINYGPDGRFYAIVVRKGRKAPPILPATEQEKSELFDSMLAYAGSYTLDDEKAVHHVDASWNESWTGTDQIRYYKLKGDRLSIHSAKVADPYTGEEILYRVEFEKLPSI